MWSGMVNLIYFVLESYIWFIREGYLWRHCGIRACYRWEMCRQNLHDVHKYQEYIFHTFYFKFEKIGHRSNCLFPFRRFRNKWKINQPPTLCLCQSYWHRNLDVHVQRGFANGECQALGRPDFCLLHSGLNRATVPFTLMNLIHS